MMPNSLLEYVHNNPNVRIEISGEPRYGMVTVTFLTDDRGWSRALSFLPLESSNNGLDLVEQIIREFERDIKIEMEASKTDG